MSAPQMQRKDSSSPYTEEMFVTNRLGLKEPILFDTILNRIRVLGNMSKLSVNYHDLVIKVIEQMYDGIHTYQIDELTAQQCASMVTIHPDYGILAAYIVTSNLHKNTDELFSDVMHTLYNFTDVRGNASPLISRELYDIATNPLYKELIQQQLDFTRDFSIDYFGLKTLERAYLIQSNGTIRERPQHMWMRVSIGIHGSDLERAFETYDLMSKKYFTHATPTLFNAGTPRPQLSSCYLLGMESDSIDGIYGTLRDCGRISKWAGGIGLHIHNVRGKGSHIRGTNGESNGIVPMLRVFNMTARYVDQCFDPNTLVMTPNGFNLICNISIGDTIINGQGYSDSVAEVHRAKYTGEMITIESPKQIHPIRVTSEHPFYVVRGLINNCSDLTIEQGIRSKTIFPEYISAKELNVNDRIIMPRPNESTDEGILTVLSDDDLYIIGLILSCGEIDFRTLNMKLHFNNDMPTHIMKRCRRHALFYKSEYTQFTDCVDNISTFEWTFNSSIPITTGMIYNSHCEKHINELFMKLLPNRMQYLLDGIFAGTCKTIGVDSQCLVTNPSYQYIGAVKRMMSICSITNYAIDTSLEGDEDINVISTDDDPIVAQPPTKFIYTKPRNISSKHVTDQIVIDLKMKTASEPSYVTEIGTVHNGGGKRNGSFAIYLEPWHPDIVQFLDLKKNHGDEEQRARDLFYAVWMCSLFMERVKADQPWSLFCPDRTPGLDNVYGDEFKTLYEKYESDGMAVRTISARELWYSILDSQMETGTPYILYKDAANQKSNQKNLGTIRSSNLCTEIIEYSDDKESAVCNLASVALPQFVTHVPRNNKTYGDIIVYSRLNCKYCIKLERFLNENNIEYTTVYVDDDDVRTKLFGELNKRWCRDGVEINTVPQICGVNISNSDVGTPTNEPVHWNGYTDFVDSFNPTFDFDELERVVGVMTTNLNRIIDINYYPTSKTERSNWNHRPIGIGVQGLADTFAMMRLSFESTEAKQLNKDIFETMYYSAMTRSNCIAKDRADKIQSIIAPEYKAGKWKFVSSEPHERKRLIVNDNPSMSVLSSALDVINPTKAEMDKLDGDTCGAYSSFNGSPLQEGMFQFDLWGVTPSGRYDWDKLRQSVVRWGTRNSLLVAPMPTASTSQILGNNECFEPFTSNIYTRRTIAGEFIVINNHLIRELIDLGLWNTTMKDLIIRNHGSVQSIESIPKLVRDRYKIVWEMSMRNIIDMAADRGAYICQSQSMNLWVEEPNYKNLTAMHFYSWSKGLKTGLYYLRRKPKHQPQQFTIEPEKQSTVVRKDDECLMCSG